MLSNPSEGVLLEPWDVLLAGVGWWEAAGWGVVGLVCRGGVAPFFWVAGGVGGLGGVESPAGGCVGESEVDEAL